LVNVGSELVGEVAEVVLDLAERLMFGEIDQSFGHLAEQLFGVGSQLLEEVLDTGFTILRGL
jgi:hypothetical protein